MDAISQLIQSEAREALAHLAFTVLSKSRRPTTTYHWQADNVDDDDNPDDNANETVYSAFLMATSKWKYLSEHKLRVFFLLLFLSLIIITHHTHRRAHVPYDHNKAPTASAYHVRFLALYSRYWPWLWPHTHHSSSSSSYIDGKSHLVVDVGHILTFSIQKGGNRLLLSLCIRLFYTTTTVSRKGLHHKTLEPFLCLLFSVTSIQIQHPRSKSKSKREPKSQIPCFLSCFLVCVCQLGILILTLGEPLSVERRGMLEDEGECPSASLWTWRGLYCAYTYTFVIASSSLSLELEIFLPLRLL